jgi:phenylacetate-coenzyme A ligase PaaK-like adenylate-forming protein
MTHFDDWVTDPAVTRAGVEAFVSDKTLIGRSYLDRYAVYTTSGTTGTPGVYLHDRDALAVYDLLWLLRGWLPWLWPWRLFSFLLPNFREVFITATGGHYAGSANMERLRRRHPWMAGRIRTLSVLLPPAELILALNYLQPYVLATYPTALDLLAQAQKEGRLRLRPLFIVTSGEWLAPTVRDNAAAAFDCPVRDIYGCSEFVYMAFACDRGCLHVNDDWLILEPVDADYRPVPPGQASHTVLLTNLANRIQPLIRYDLGDSITISTEPCPCGNPLPAIQVEGRRDEILSLPAADGTKIRILPMALAAVVEITPGVCQYQVIQTGLATLSVHLSMEEGADAGLTWEAVAGRLQDYLATQSASGVTIEKAVEPPQRDPVSGKFRQVWSQDTGV